MAIFNSYVSLPEGSYLLVTFRHRFCWNPNSTSKSWILRCDFDGEKKLMQPIEETSINAEADVPNSHWLVDFHRGVSSEKPEKQVNDDRWDEPVPGPNLFLPNGHYWRPKNICRPKIWRIPWRPTTTCCPVRWGPWENSLGKLEKKAPRKREMLGHIYLIGDIYLTHPYILAIYIAIYIGMGQISVYIGVFVKKPGMGQIYGLESDTFHVIHWFIINNSLDRSKWSFFFF